MNQDILTDLNEEQKKAVTAQGGPILIIAGAGTGKTRVITRRIAYLIKTVPGLLPSNILALTFSKKAAQEMLERVEDLIGAHQDEIWISTFHSFCHRILKDQADCLNLPRNFRLLDRVEQWIFFREILPDLKLKHYLNLSDPSRPIEGFLRFINRSKDELILPQDYEHYVKTLPQDEDKSKEEELAKVYSIYQQKCLEKGCLDFGDLIMDTLKLFSKEPKILVKYQNQFRYILVDEFQDTNVAQIELISLLCGADQNICVVGDDDQAIYRFRGASFDSFIRFKNRFSHLRDLSLTQNYRSGQNILNLANRLIVHNAPDRYSPDKKLFTQNKQPQKTVVLSSHDYEFEAVGVVEKIKEIYHSLPPGEKSFSVFAVLYRAHSHKERIVKALKKEKIPYMIKGGSGLLESGVIRDLVSYLRVINDPDDSVSLFRILSSLDFCPKGINIPRLIELNKLAKEKEIPLFAALETFGKDDFGDFIGQFNNLLVLAQKESLAEFFYAFLEKIIYPRYRVFSLENLPAEEKEKFSHIIRFHRWLDEYVKNHSPATLKDFLRYLNFYIEAEGELEDETWNTPEEEGVRLMSIHQAKGLEFPYVFVIGLVQNRFPARNHPEIIPFPLALMKEKLPQGDFHLQEERRLFYVAITRAQKKLFLSYVEKPYHRPSLFLKEIGAYEADKFDDLEMVKLEYDRFEEEFKNRLGVESDTTPSYAYSAAEDKKYIPENFRLSFSQIDTYLGCPLKYKYSYIYHIPARPSAPLKFGSDIHKVLEEFYRRLSQGEIPSLEELHRIYLKYWTALGYLDKMQEAAYQKSGFKILEEFYNKNKDFFKPPLYIEEEFLLKVGPHWIRGYIDRIDPLDDGTVEVVDYKTGRAKDQALAQESIQLDIYALACQEVFSLKPSLLSFYYLTTNEKVSIKRSEEDLKKTKILIKEVTAKIEEGIFPPQVSFRCKWCDYQILCPAYNQKS